jgi:hypothetical protein
MMLMALLRVTNTYMYIFMNIKIFSLLYSHSGMLPNNETVINLRIAVGTTDIHTPLHQVWENYGPRRFSDTNDVSVYIVFS